MGLNNTDQWRYQNSEMLIKKTSGRKIVAMEVVSNWSRHVNEINYTILDSKWFNWKCKDWFDSSQVLKMQQGKAE